jgi:hypothetical protein
MIISPNPKSSHELGSGIFVTEKLSTKRAEFTAGSMNPSDADSNRVNAADRQYRAKEPINPVGQD